MITKDYLNSIFEYKDGDLYWKVDRGSNKLKGKKAGVYTKNGYCKIGIDGIRYFAHRLIFMMNYGYLPQEIDHINGLSNRIENLRPASHAENMKNCKIPKDNTSGFKNIGWHKASKKWRVSINAKNKNIHIGLFKDLELAELVAQEARDKYHGKFARHF